MRLSQAILRDSKTADAASREAGGARGSESPPGGYLVGESVSIFLVPFRLGWTWEYVDVTLTACCSWHPAEGFCPQNISFDAPNAIVLPGATDGAVRPLVVAAVKESIRAVSLFVGAAPLAVEREAQHAGQGLRRVSVHRSDSSGRGGRRLS